MLIREIRAHPRLTVSKENRTVVRTSEEIESALAHLDEADQEFVVRFVLASGSLKDVAQGYGVSYPTIRIRLDRVIARLQELRRGQPVSPLRELLAKLVEKGELGATAARRILDEHRKEVDQT